MKKVHLVLLLALIFCMSLGLRLYFAFQTPYYDFDAYFNIRQIDNLLETGKPMFYDTQVADGRVLIYSPAFHYFLAFFRLFLPEAIVFKIIPNILASCLVFIVYFIALKITEHQNISLLTAFISAFIPQFLAETINAVSVYSVVIPLIFLTLYFLLEIEKKNYSYYFSFSAFFLAMIHPSSLILVIGLILYGIIMKLEHMKQQRQETEAILFSMFLIFWTQFLIYKKAFLNYGIATIWQNIPKELLSDYFTDISFINAIFGVGLIPLLAGIYIVYKFLFKAKNDKIYLLISFVIAVSLLLYFKFIQLTMGLMFLGCLLVLLFSQLARYVDISLNRSRFSTHENKIMFVVIILIIITMIIPAFDLSEARIANSPSSQEVAAMDWVSQNTPADSTIVAPLGYGYLAEAVANRKVIIDKEFISTKNPTEKIDAIKKIYTTVYKTDAIYILGQYDADYILISESIKQKFNIEGLKYADNECFKLVYDQGTQVYALKCTLEEV